MIIDIAFVVFLLLAFSNGYKKGIIHSIFSVLALLIGLFAALKFGNDLAQFIHSDLGWHSSVVPLLSFLLVFILACMLVAALSKAIEKFLDLILLGFFNKLAGGLLWLVIVTLVFSTFLFFINQMNLISMEQKNASHVYYTIQPLAPFVINFVAGLLPFLEGLFESFESMFEEITDKDRRSVLFENTHLLTG